MVSKKHIKARRKVGIDFYQLWKGDEQRVNCRWCGRPLVISLKSISEDSDCIDGYLEAYDESKTK